MGMALRGESPGDSLLGLGLDELLEQLHAIKDLADDEELRREALLEEATDEYKHRFIARYLPSFAGGPEFVEDAGPPEPRAAEIPDPPEGSMPN